MNTKMQKPSWKNGKVDAANGLPPIGGDRRIKFKDLAELELTDYRKNKYSSIEDLEIRFDKHVLPFFGHMKAMSIGPADVNLYVVRRQEEGAANGTINRELTAIIRAFTLGVEFRLIPFAPKIETLEENNVRKGFFQREQLDSVLPHLRPRNQAPAPLCFCHGLGETGNPRAALASRGFSDRHGLPWARNDEEQGSQGISLHHGASGDPGEPESKIRGLEEERHHHALGVFHWGKG